VPGVAADHNDRVYEAFTRFFYSRPLKPLNNRPELAGKKGAGRSKGKGRKAKKA